MRACARDRAAALEAVREAWRLYPATATGALLDAALARAGVGEPSHVARSNDSLSESRDLRLALAAVERVLVDEPAARAAPAERVAALEAAIFAAPDEDEPRLMLADLLQEAGDRRGELIALQLEATRRALTDGESARLARMNAALGERLLGPLAPWVAPEGLELARGFLARCRLRGGLPAELTPIGDLPEWATVVELHLTYSSGLAPMVARPPFRGLRRLEGAPPAIVAALERAEHPLALEHLGFAGSARELDDDVDGDDDAARGLFTRLAALVDRGLLPRLSSLAISAGDRELRGPVAFGAPLASRLARLRILPRSWDRGILLALDGRPRETAVVEAFVAGTVFRVRRAAPTVVEVDWEGGPGEQPHADWLRSLLPSLRKSWSVTAAPTLPALLRPVVEDFR